MAAVAETCVDTDPGSAEFQLSLLRASTPGQRARLARSLSRSVITLARRAIRRNLGAAATEEEIGVRFVELHYGAALARELRSGGYEKKR